MCTYKHIIVRKLFFLNIPRQNSQNFILKIYINQASERQIAVLMKYFLPKNYNPETSVTEYKRNERILRFYCLLDFYYHVYGIV